VLTDVDVTHYFGNLEKQDFLDLIYGEDKGWEIDPTKDFRSRRKQRLLASLNVFFVIKMTSEVAS
jgi:hypothetical protein